MRWGDQNDEAEAFSKLDMVWRGAHSGLYKDFF